MFLGDLKVAPEHTSDPVLKLMRKPSFKYFHKFKERFDKINIKKGLNLQLIPYFISNHPACEVEDMANLSCRNQRYGLPVRASTRLYTNAYDGCYRNLLQWLPPIYLEKVNTPKTRKEKDEQHRFFFWYKDENKDWIKKHLK